jgi:alkylation response protein AidB-like acyl-CoA dehydrogenase
MPLAELMPSRRIGELVTAPKMNTRVSSNEQREAALRGSQNTAGSLQLLSEQSFREMVREWFHDHLRGEFAELGDAGGPGLEHEGFDVRVAWERELGESGWIGLGWPEHAGGLAATIAQQIIFAEEYALVGAPARVNHMGENLLGPTLIEFGSAAQHARFLQPILDGNERWCQGYSEPNAGSDLANVSTKATLNGDYWILNGQKVWTSLAHVSHWCFVVARTDPLALRHRGLSFLLVPMDQPGVEVRPIVQITGTGEFNEVFFTDATTESELVVGQPNDGWRIAMALLGFERGVSTLAQQVGFQRELDHLIDLCRNHGVINDPRIRQRLMRFWTELKLMRWNAMRTMSNAVPGPEASISKLLWATWHRDLTNMMIDVMGPAGLVAHTGSLVAQSASRVAAADQANAVSHAPGYQLNHEQRLALFTRSDTIYGGSNEVQRNVIGERSLGLPKEPVSK